MIVSHIGSIPKILWVIYHFIVDRSILMASGLCCLRVVVLSVCGVGRSSVDNLLTNIQLIVDIVFVTKIRNRYTLRVTTKKIHVNTKKLIITTTL